MLSPAIFSCALAFILLCKPYVGLPKPALDMRLTLLRFPSQEKCRYWTTRACEHLRWIDEQAKLHPADRAQWMRYREQVEAWMCVWEALETAQRWPYWADDETRMKLVREAIGEDNWRRGYVPPPIASYFLDKGELVR